MHAYSIDVRERAVQCVESGACIVPQASLERWLARWLMRAPVEDEVVTISGAQRSLTFPANFRLVAGMNPCHADIAGALPYRPKAMMG